MRVSSRSASAARLLAAQALWTSLGLGIGVLASLSVPLLAGYHSFTIMSGSMEPTIGTGDIIVTRPIPPVAAHIGDVVTFSDPMDATRLVTHRVRSLEVRGGDAYFETKGDANNTVERWTVPVDGRIGRVSYRVPNLGFPLRWISAPSRRLFVVVLPILAAGALTLLRIWRPPEERSPRTEGLG